MTGSVSINSANFKLNEFLSTMSRDTGQSVAGRSLSVASAGVAMAPQVVARVEAAEVTDEMKSGETDPDTLVKVACFCGHQNSAVADCGHAARSPRHRDQITASTSPSPAAPSCCWVWLRVLRCF